MKLGQVAELASRRLGVTHHRYSVLEQRVEKSNTTLTLNAAYGDADDALTPGMLITCQDEVMHVMRVISTTQVEVIRGFGGTANMAHEPNHYLSIDPRFPMPFILEAVRSEIRSWEPMIFAVETVNGSSNNTSETFVLPNVDESDVLHLLEVEGVFAGISATRRSHLVRDPRANQAIVHITDDWSGALRVTYARRFKLTDVTSDTDIADIGMTDNMAELAAVGAAYRMMVGAEVVRTDLQVMAYPRSAENVSPGHIGQVSRELQRERQRLFTLERQNLLTRWPIRYG